MQMKACAMDHNRGRALLYACMGAHLRALADVALSNMGSYKAATHSVAQQPVPALGCAS